MKLLNFRQYIGSQELHFSIDKNKNITIIMGENGSGKTTLSQAFTWCLYGKTDFKDDDLLCKEIAKNMEKDSTEIVKIDIELIHNNISYIISREQKYTKNYNGIIGKPKESKFMISYKDETGQMKFLDNFETEKRMNEILPSELSKYFFFDGERIDKMSKDIKDGRSPEFGQAVRGLLGLSPFLSALEHLLDKKRNSVIKSYDQSYDSKSDINIKLLSEKITDTENKITIKQDRIKDIIFSDQQANLKLNELRNILLENKETHKLESERIELLDKIKKNNSVIESKKNSFIKVSNDLLTDFFSIKMINDVLEELKNSEKIDKGIPDIQARTIDFLIKRGFCVCGNKINPNSQEIIELEKLLDFIPPKSIGTLLNEFLIECKIRLNRAENFFPNIKEKYIDIKSFEKENIDFYNKIEFIDEKVRNVQSLNEIQRRIDFYNEELKKNSQERDEINQDLGVLKNDIQEYISNRKTYILKDDDNKKIEIYKTYAQFIYDKIFELYTKREEETRSELQKNINEIYKEIYSGDFSLSVDKNYNLKITNDDYSDYMDNIETGTAQGISIIFSFIAGVIKMARENNQQEDDLMQSEPYPLVMDAPLSSFDKKRIKNVCNTLPKIAEQIIFFIKDTDGEIAEENMIDKIGKRYLIEKENEFKTYIYKR
jgi:DNA sulfur modification protein DndD